MPQDLETLPLGTITQVNLSGGFGTVTGDDEKKLEFRFKDAGVWVAPDGPAPTVGMRVRYLAPTSGKRAEKVYWIAPEVREPEIRETDPALPVVPKRPHRYADDGTAFLNPYNFVRPLATPEPLVSGDADVALLGRCPPPPHDRYLGLSGRLRCTITTNGPVFVGDSHEAFEDEAGHRSFQFHRTLVDGEERPAVPGSSLRGVVRSVFEAVTNSCWEHVHDARLGRRFNADEAKQLVPARLRCEAGRCEVELFTGTTGYLEHGAVAHREQYAAWVLRYRPADGGRVRVSLPPGLKHGDPCLARIRRIGRNGISIWNVEALGRNRASVEDPTVDERDVRIVEGFYACNGETVSRKHDERFFFNDGPAAVVKVEPRAVDLYRDLLTSYQEFYEKAKGTANAAPPSRFVHEPVPATNEGCNQHLVYAWVEGPRDACTVRALTPVTVPRLLYQNTVRERFPDLAAVAPCSDVNRGRGGKAPSLCPACRTFGWVMADPGAEGDDRDGERRTPERGAYRSRVRFGDAVFDDSALVKTACTLPALSAPKPTTVRFYLTRENRNLQDRAYGEAAIDYDSKATAVRGRKFYRRGREPRMHDAPTNQNRTIREHLGKGASASFTVWFHNLAGVELGALLWALELEGEGWEHRLGLGKPLGMGAVRISIEAVDWLAPERYAAVGEGMGSLAGDAVQAVVERLKEQFRGGVARRHDVAGGFAEMENVRDLAAMLSAERPRLPVEYPWLRTGPQEEGGHIWFGVNRRVKRHHGNRGEAHWLDLADDDGGLPRDPTIAP